MKGNLKSWMFMFVVAGVIALVAACGAKGDTGAAGNCPDLGGPDVNPPTTTITKNTTASTFTLTCTDAAATISGATTPAGTCGNTYYSLKGGTWTLYSGAVAATAGDAIKYYSWDKACNGEAVNSTTF